MYTSKIYKQTTAGQCGAYASLNALQRMGVDISEEKMLSYPSMFGFPDIERTLVKRGLIKGLSYVVSPRRISNYLKEGIPLVCLMYRNNFDSVRNTPFIQDFKGRMNHFVCIVEDCGDFLKYCDQQGENFGDKGYGYIRKSEIVGNTRIAKLNI